MPQQRILNIPLRQTRIHLGSDLPIGRTADLNYNTDKLQIMIRILSRRLNSELQAAVHHQLWILSPLTRDSKTNLGQKKFEEQLCAMQPAEVVQSATEVVRRSLAVRL